MSGVLLKNGICQAEMFLDADTMRAFILMEKISWCKGNYRCEEPDPSTFPVRWATGQSDLPLKYVDIEDLHRPAAEGYARALRTGMANGPPKYLLKVEIPQDPFLQHIEKGDIRIYAEMQTVAFTKKMNKENYPQIKITGADIDDDVGLSILETVYEEKPTLRKKRIPEEEADWKWSKKARKTTENQSAAEEEIFKILPEVHQFMKSHSAGLEAIKNHLESLCSRGADEKIANTVTLRC